MKPVFNHSLRVIILTIGLGFLQGCDPAPQQAAEAVPETGQAVPAGAAAVADDVIATVGDQDIHFSDLNTMLNSSAVVGVSIPALGTPERDTVRITLLDKVVDANLLYLDALKQGLDQDPAYQQEMRRFSEAILMSLYRNQVLLQDVEVSNADIEAFHQENSIEGTELTDEMRTVIAANLRTQRIAAQTELLRVRLREGVTVELNDAAMDPLEDAERPDDTVLATIDGVALTWGEAKDRLGTKVSSASSEDRRAAVNALVDMRISVDKALDAGLDKDPAYLARINEYRKTRLINLHRGRLAAGMEPDDETLRAYFDENRARITVPENRKVQMAVLESKEEAEALKAMIEAGELTMYQVVAEHSIAPEADKNLGEIGWVAQGKALPELNDMVFSLGPGEIGGPVQVGEVWHLVTVQDLRDAKFTDIADRATRKLARRMYIHDKLAKYTTGLRENDFPVEVYEDKLIALAQQEADMVKELTAKAGEPGSVTQQRIEELQEIFNQ
jgi:parvulin-like peptidyl-prolyl isomerase